MVFSPKFWALAIVMAALLPESEGRTFRRLTSLVEVPPGHEFDDSDLLPATEDPGVTNGQCWNKKATRFQNVGDKEHCQDLTPNRVRPDLVGRWCECQIYEDRPKWRPAGWIDAPTDPADPSGGVSAKFFGNIVAHAKILCQVVEGIDCWQEKKKPKFPFRPFSTSPSSVDEEFDAVFGAAVPGTENMVQITTPDGEQKFAAKADIIGTVRKICKVIDGGVGELPKLLPGLGEDTGGLPGIPNLLGRLVGGLLGGGGIPGLGKLFDWFRGIFVVEGESSVSSFAEGKIVLYNSPTGPEE